VTRGRAAIASWAETGRYSPPPKRERLRDLVQAGIALRAGRCPPPLIAAWLAEAIEQLDEQLAAGGRPSLHRLLDLPDRSWSQGRRRLVRHERNRALRIVAAALPAELSPWERARELAAVLANPDTAHRLDTVRGYLVGLRAELLGRVPRTVRSLYRITRDR
jgi:hypothetical protein